jgi:hypothetical protein
MITFCTLLTSLFCIATLQVTSLFFFFFLHFVTLQMTGPITYSSSALFQVTSLTTDTSFLSIQVTGLNIGVLFVALQVTGLIIGVLFTT